MRTINKLTKLVLSFLLVITCINFSIVQAEDGSDENYSEPTAVETISEEPASEPEQEVIPEEPVAEEPVVEEAAPVEEEKQEEAAPEVIEEAKVEEGNNTPEIEAEPSTQEETVESEVQQEAPVAPEVQKVETVEEVKVTVVVSYVDESDHPLTDPITGSYPTEYRLNENVDAFKSFDGYAFEKVIVNDDAKNTISKDDVQKNGFRITKDMTSLKLVYQKMNLESNENKEVIPEVTEEAVEEAEPESNTNETELSAFDQTAFAGKVGVHASAAEGVLPKGARLIVEQVNRKAILNAVENTVSDNNKEMDSAVALDISIVDKDGVEIQPNGVVNITFVNTGVSGDEVKIYHVEDDASAVTEIANNTDSFDASHFSIYVITGENKPPLTTFNFVVNDTTVGKQTTVSTQIVKSGDTLIAPTAPDMIGQAFVGWVDEAGNPFTGFGKQAEITETTTRTITARYEAALYVYFLNPDGTQIMRTEKVGDHEEHDFTTVSYDVDSTHKLVGWADEKNGTKNIADEIRVPTDKTSVNVYAIIEQGYWVTFDSDGGSIVDSQFVLHGDNLDLDKIPNPTKPGYTFDGWYNGSAKVKDGATVTNPMTLKAHWNAAEVSYTVIHWWENADDDGYSFHESQELQGLTGESTAAVAKSYITSGKNIHGESVKDKVFTATSISQKTIKGDGSTIVNVYYKRKTYTMHFKKRWNSLTDLSTITKKWGQSISKNEWPTYYGNGNWQISSSRYLAFTSSMPMNDSTLCSTSGDYTYNAYYYVQKVDGSGYDLHHTDTIKMDSYPTIGKEDCYAIVGFTYSHGDPGEGGYYENAKFYYTRNTYKIRFINNGKEDKSVEKKYEQSISSENYTPARPNSLPEYYVFDGWYENELCEGEAFNFTGQKMPAQNVTLYAKWSAEQISLTYNLNNPEGTVAKDTKKVEAGTVASTALPSIPTINEYSFAGWYVADQNDHMTTEVFNANDPILKDTNVIGKWLYNGKLTIKYVADGVEAPKDSNVYAGGAKATVANGVTKDGKKFLGWQLGGNVYQPSQNFEVNKDLADDKNVITLTAVFGDSETSAILTYHRGNGKGEDQSVAILNNVEVTLESTSNLHYSAPGKDYYFAGWATSMEDAQKGNATYAAGDKVRVNADSSNDLYATWVKKTVIEVTANSNTLPYNGEEQKVDGFKDVTAGYEVTGLKAEAKGTNFGTYDTVITGTEKVTKGGADVTDKVIVNKINGTLTISKREVTLKSETASKPYDGTPLTKPEVTITGEFVKGEVSDIKATGSVTNVSEGKVTNTITYKTSDKFNSDNYAITKDEGKLSITPVTDEVTVKIKGNRKTTPYNGEEQSVSGYTVESISNTLYSSTDFTLNGQATATGKDANTYPMNLDVTQFVNNNTNFSNVKFEIAEDGQLVITPVTDKVTVTIKGHEDTATYDGNPHSVEGYEVTNISNELYKADYIGFTGEAKAEGIEAATYQMNLKKDQFSNTSQNFTDVEFVVEDGSLTISPKSITPDGPDTPEEKKTGITVTAPEGSKYDGEEHKNKPTVTDTKTDKVLVEGTDYELSYSEDVINAGKVTVTVKGIGNYKGSFEVTYEITKRDVTLISGSASKVYDKTALTKDEVTVSGDGFVKDEGATYKVTGSRTKVGTSKNTFTYELKSNTTASNYNIEVKFGDLIVTAEDGEVVVTITGHSDSVEYDGNEKTVSGYDVAITEGSKYTTDDFTFNGTAEAKGTEAGTYPMNLAADQFTNTNDNYEKVTFIVNDGTLTITPKPINPDDEKNGITVTDPINSTYDGNEHINGLTVTDAKLNTTLVEGTDYTLTYSGDLTNVGTVTITIKGIGNYTGEFTKTYQILPREYTVTTNTDSKVYDGTALTAGGTVNNLVEGETVNLTMTGSQTNVGTSDNTYELNWTGTAKKANYTHGTDSIGTLTVTKKSIVPDGPDTPEEKKTGITVTAPEGSKYDGEEHRNKPKVEDTKAKATLKEGKDYELSYSEDAVNAGTVTVTVTGIGNYEGSFEVTYEITKRHVTLTSADDKKVYDGSALTNDTVTVGGDKFAKKEGATYNVTGMQIEKGSSKNTFTYTLNEGTLAGNYDIETFEGTLTVTAFENEVVVTIKGHKDTVTYDGNPHSVEGYEITDISNKLYKADYVGFTGEAKAGGTAAGTYKMNLSAQQFSNTSASFDNVTFKVEDGSLTINPKSITPDGPDTPEEKKTGITVTAPEGSKYDGEEHKNKPTVTDTKTDKVLVEGTDYELSYSEDVINAGKVTVTVKGIGNYEGSFEVTYEITKRDVVLTSATDSKPYDGTALRNENVEVTGDGFAAGEGATFAVTGTITNVGTKANTFGYALNKNTLASNYNISTELGTLTITPKSIIPDGPETPEEKKTGITVENPGDVKYDGKDHAEKPVVKDEKTGVTLEEGKDYEIVYPDDIKNAGEITATVVGKGDYEGSFEIKYNITKRDVTFTSATDSKQYDGNALTNGNVEITGDGFIEGEGAEYKVTGTQTQVGNSANEFEYTLNENTLASNYDITKVVGILTVTAAPAPETPEKPKPEVKKSVDTSDDNNTVFYGNAFFMAMITLAGIIVLRKKSS